MHCCFRNDFFTYLKFCYKCTKNWCILGYRFIFISVLIPYALCLLWISKCMFWSLVLESLQTSCCWAHSIWLSILHGVARECMSRTHNTSSPSYFHTSCLVPLCCPWELSCCLGATFSAFCLAHCCALPGCHIVCWSRRVGCLQMARQMEACFPTVWVSFQPSATVESSCQVLTNLLPYCSEMRKFMKAKAMFSSSSEQYGPVNGTVYRDLRRSFLNRFCFGMSKNGANRTSSRGALWTQVFTVT